MQKVEGRDETGHAYTRYFTALQGDVHPSEYPNPSVTPEVRFQRIVYDGLVGDTFLRNFVVTYDVASARMHFARPRR